MKTTTINLIVLGILNLFLFSCSKDDDPTPTVDTGDKYALFTVVKADGAYEYSLYMQTIKDLKSETDYNNQKATEAVAKVQGFGSYEFDGDFYVNTYVAPEKIEKWSYNKDVGFQKQGSINVAELSFNSNVCFKDKNTAFIGGPSLNKILIFNPETMQKTGYIDYSSFSRLGEVTNYPETGNKINIQAPTEMIIRDNYLFIAFGFQLEFYKPASPTADMLVVDLTKIDVNSSNNSGAIVKWISSDKGSSIGAWNTGFGGNQYITKDEKGDIYMICHNYWGGNDSGKPTCILRIKKGETNFDPNYYFDLETPSRGKGNAVSNFCYAGNGDFFATSNDKSALDPNNPFSYYTDPIAQWYKFNLYSKSVQKVSDDYTVGSAAGYIYVENGKAYIPHQNKTEAYVKEVDINSLENKKIFNTAGTPRIIRIKK